jgi:hypothetical protein
MDSFNNIVVGGKVRVVPGHAMKAYRGNRNIAELLTSALEGGEWSTSRRGRITLAK